MIYKTLKKVSEYCQLLDKSKLPNTQTVNGITYTVDKVNGTITANGTAIAESTYKTDIALNNAESYTNGGGTKIPSRLLFLGCPIGGSQTTYGFYNNWVSSYVVDTGNGGITNTTSKKYYEYYRFALRITIKQGYTVNNLVFKPKVFDLTEMYGAGNEPTTVEEFRQDFPEELYDYKPYCFVKSYKTLLKVSDDKIITSYKKSLICTTKNLFDNIPVKTNYIINNKGEEVASPGYNIYGKMYGNNFTISTNAPVDLTHSDNWLRVCLYNSSGTFIARRDFDFNTRTVANIADDNMAYIQLCLNRTSFPNYKLQVELGDTATEYHPYGYL